MAPLSDTGNIAAGLFSLLVKGDRVALGKAMTLVESDRYDDRKEAVSLLALCESKLRHEPLPVRFAVSGAPGAGKSTWIESTGLKAISEGYKVGVITIDPSSSISHGSILGDKSRMTKLSVSPHAFIRSSPAGSILGGLSRRAYELMTLVAAAGYNLVFLETVGVGQSEHTAWQFTDGFILVIQPGAGDELQGIKRGITELADIVIVNKADGAMKALAKTAAAHYRNALSFFSPLRPFWSPRTVSCSALDGTGIDETWEVIRSYHEAFARHSTNDPERHRQKIQWLSWSLGLTANELMMNHPAIKARLQSAIDDIGEDAHSLFSIEFEIENEMKALIAISRDHHE